MWSKEEHLLSSLCTTCHLLKNLMNKVLSSLLLIRLLLEHTCHSSRLTSKRISEEWFVDKWIIGSLLVNMVVLRRLPTVAHMDRGADLGLVALSERDSRCLRLHTAWEGRLEKLLLLKRWLVWQLHARVRLHVRDLLLLMLMHHLLVCLKRLKLLEKVTLAMLASHLGVISEVDK